MHQETVRASTNSFSRSDNTWPRISRATYGHPEIVITKITTGRPGSMRVFLLPLISDKTIPLMRISAPGASRSIQSSRVTALNPTFPRACESAASATGTTIITMPTMMNDRPTEPVLRHPWSAHAAPRPSAKSNTGNANMTSMTAGEERIHPTAVVAGNHPEGHPDQHDQGGRDQRHHQRDPSAIERPAEHVPAQVRRCRTDSHHSGCSRFRTGARAPLDGVRSEDVRRTA